VIHWDYDDGQTTQSGPDVPIAPTLNGAPRSLAPYKTENLTQLSNELAGAKNSNVHTLEVVVSDRGFVSGGEPLNQAPNSGGLTATLRWTVTFVTRGTTCDVNICNE
jgi:hypothetical protein